MGLNPTKLYRLVRLVLSWGLTCLVVCVLLIGIYVYHHIDEKIRSQVESHLSTCFPHFSIAVRSARLIERSGFEISGLSFSTQPHLGNRAEIAHFNEVRVHCRPRLGDMLSGELQVSRIVARKLTIRVVRNNDGTWNLAPLFSGQLASGGKVPRIVVEDATIEIVDLGKEPPSLLTLRGINMSCSHVSHIESQETGRREGDDLRITGTMAGDHLRLAELQGTLDISTGHWNIEGKAFELSVTPELIQSLPATVSSRLPALKPLRAWGSVTVEADGNLDDWSAVKYRATGQIHDGQYASGQLPYPVTDIQAKVLANNQGISVQQLTARYGRGTVRIRSATRQSSGKVELDGSLSKIPIDRPLVNMLPPPLVAEWNKLQPLGTVDAEVKLSFDGQTWSPQIHTRWSGMGLKWSRYPVQLNDGRATVELKNNVLSVRDAVVYFRDQPIEMRAVVSQPGHSWTGWVEAWSSNKVMIDDRLIDAMEERPRRIVRDFAPRGSLSFFSRIQKETADSPEVRKQFIADLSECTIRYSKFAYPLEGVSGRLRRNDDLWFFEQLRGDNDGASVICNGSWDSHRIDNELLLTFQAQNVSLESQLKEALPKNYQKLWSDLRPRGVLNQALLELSYSPARTIPRIDLQLRQPEGTTHDHAISLNPVWFPYALEDASGSVTLRDGQVVLRQLKAKHGPVRFSATAECRFQTDGTWDFHFQRLSADQVPVDRELIGAMPASVSKALSTLEVRGKVHVDGSIVFRGSNDPRVPVQSQWDMDVFTTGASMVCAVPLEHVTGLLHLQGDFNGDRLRCGGRIEMDSALWNGIQFTQVNGPIWIDETQIGLGNWAASVHSPTPKPPHHVTGNVFGGQLQGDARLQLDANAEFQLRASLANAKLAEILRDVAPGTQKARGQTFGVVELTGNSQGLPSLTGRGKIGLREAELYDLPLMVALLKVLRIGSTDRTAFTSSDMSFRIRGDHLQFDQLDLSGDAISLKGNGWMNLDQRINLDFYTLVGRESDYIPDLLPFLREASRNVLQIHVAGTMSDPATMGNVLPGLNETLQRMFPETAKSSPKRDSAKKPDGKSSFPNWN